MLTGKIFIALHFSRHGFLKFWYGAFSTFFFLLHDKLLCSMLAECENYMFGFTTTLKFSGSVVTDSKNLFFFLM